MSDESTITRLENWRTKMDIALTTSAPISKPYPLPTIRVGIHLIPGSTNYESHKDYIRKLKPSVITIRQRVKNLKSGCTTHIIILSAMGLLQP